jgi:hypothetical protein
VKRAATVTLLCMGVGAVFAANGLEGRCRADDNSAPETPSCRSGGSGHGGYGHSFGHSGVARGGFGGAGHGSGGA